MRYLLLILLTTLLISCGGLPTENPVVNTVEGMLSEHIRVEIDYSGFPVWAWMIELPVEMAVVIVRVEDILGTWFEPVHKIEGNTLFIYDQTGLSVHSRYIIEDGATS